MCQIIVIDDDKGVRKTSRVFLENHQYHVLEAENGDVGLKLIEKHAPELVITDIFMPVMDGILTIQKLAKIRPDLPIIAIAEYNKAIYLQIAQRLGATTGLCKPFTELELMAKIYTVTHQLANICRN